MMRTNPFFQEPIRTNETGIELQRINKQYPSIDVKIQKLCILDDDPKILEQHLLPGDILLSFYPETYTWTQKTIKTVQWFENKSEVCGYLHASIYLGDGKIAEAISDKDKVDLKINLLTHENFQIKKGHKNQFHVFRCKASKIAHKVAVFAQIIARSHKHENNEAGSYNYTTAALSPFIEKSLNKGAIKRYLKAAIFAQNNEIPVDRFGARNFHCSYLVIWLYQAAESEFVIDEINKTTITKIKFPDLSLCQSKKEKGETISEWAKSNLNEHEEELRGLIKINLNAKAVTPANMYQFFKSTPNLFEQAFKIVAKKSTDQEK